MIERVEQALSLHRLVQEVLQEVLSEEERQQWMERAVSTVRAHFPIGAYGAYDMWPLCESLLPHALICAKWTLILRQMQPEGTRLLGATGGYLHGRGLHNEAEPLLERALRTVEKQFGAAHPYTAASLINLALLYKAQGRYREAEPLYQRALAIDEEQLGAIHPQTATCLNNLAELYRVNCRYRG